jgi:low molecular weight protein-tyrosine phosphatase
MIRNAGTAMADPFRIVFVCTGNRFRSPLAEALVRRAVDGLGVEVGSFGTLDLGPAAPLPEAIEEGDRLGVDLRGHRARPLAGSDLGAADLVVGFERQHVAAAVVDARAPRERTFTLPELVHNLRLFRAPAGHDALTRARLGVALAHGARPPTSMLPAAAEIADPLGRSRRTQRAVADRVDELTTPLVSQLFGLP